MYYGQPPWQGMSQGFGGTPYPVFIPTSQTAPGGKPPSTKAMSPKRMFKEMLAAQKSWEEFQKTGGKKPDDKPKVPMYTFPQVALFFLAFGMPVGLIQLWGVIAMAKSLMGPMAASLGVK